MKQLCVALLECAQGNCFPRSVSRTANLFSALGSPWTRSRSGLWYIGAMGCVSLDLFLVRSSKTLLKTTRWVWWIEVGEFGAHTVACGWMTRCAVWIYFLLPSVSPEYGPFFVSSPPFRKGIHIATKNQASSCCEASHTVLNASENTLPSRLPMPMLYQAIDLRWLKPRLAGWWQLFWYAFCRHISEHWSLPYRCRVPAIENPRVSNIFSTMNNKKEYRLCGE